MQPDPQLPFKQAAMLPVPMFPATWAAAPLPGRSAPATPWLLSDNPSGPTAGASEPAALSALSQLPPCSRRACGGGEAWGSNNLYSTRMTTIAGPACRTGDRLTACPKLPVLLPFDHGSAPSSFPLPPAPPLYGLLGNVVCAPNVTWPVAFSACFVIFENKTVAEKGTVGKIEYNLESYTSPFVNEATAWLRPRFQTLGCV